MKPIIQPFTTGKTDTMKNKTKVIPLNGEYYVISNEEIKEGDIMYDSINHHVVTCTDGGLKDNLLSDDTQMAYSRESTFKIIASTKKLEGCQLLNRDQVEEELKIVNVKKVFNDNYKCYIWKSEEEERDAFNSFVLGYNTAGELKKEKRFTFDDMNKCWIQAIRKIHDPLTATGFTSFIQSLTKTERECEIVMRQKSNNGSIPVGEEWQYEPKVNEQGYITIKVI